jgi:hypothetical protein
MEVSYHLSQIGLGDLIFFCSHVLKHHNPGDKIYIKLNQYVLENYKNKSENYKNFCYRFLNHVLYQFQIINYEHHNNQHLNDWVVNRFNFNENLKDTLIFENIKNVLFGDSFDSNSSDYVVLFTKVRDYNYKNFEKISVPFFEKINNLNHKIVLLGEKQILYEGEYKLGNGELKSEMIYSLYDEFLKKINSNKIIDLTTDILNEETIDLDRIIQELDIISKSKKILSIGCGGFFCLSIFSEKLLNLSNLEIYNELNSQSNKQIFYNHELFLEKII